MLFSHGERLSRTCFEYDQLGNCLRLTDRYGNATELSYSRFGTVTKIKMPDGKDENGNAVPREVIKKTDLHGLECSVTDENGYQTRYKNTSLRKPYLIGYADGSFEVIKYNLKGEVIAKKERSNSHSYMEYDALGRLVSHK